MALFYPHRQTLVIALVCAIVVGGAAYFSFKGSTSNSAPSAQATVSANTQDSQPILADTDWQKEFYSSSTPNFDSSSASKNQTATTSPLTLTDVFGEDFFSKFMEVQQAGLTNDPDVMNNMSNQLMSDSLGSVDTPQPFPLSSIHIVNVTDQASLQKYASSVSAILSAYIPDQDHNEATLAEQALEQGDTDALSSIDPIIANYESALKALMIMPVPQPLASYHLDLMNGIAVSLFNAQSLRHVDTDPVKGMAAIGLEVQGLQYMSNAVSEIQQYLASNGVTFG